MTDPSLANAAMFIIGALDPLLLLAASTDIPLSDIAGLCEFLDRLVASCIAWVPPVMAIPMDTCTGGMLGPVPKFDKLSTIDTGVIGGKCDTKSDAELGGIIGCPGLNTPDGRENPSFSKDECKDDRGGST